MSKHITMTQQQTAIYDRDNAESVDLMGELRKQAQGMREDNETVEIYTADGIVAEVIQ